MEGHLYSLWLVLPFTLQRSAPIRRLCVERTSACTGVLVFLWLCEPLVLFWIVFHPKHFELVTEGFACDLCLPIRPVLLGHCSLVRAAERALPLPPIKKKRRDIQTMTGSDWDSVHDTLTG